MRRLVALGVVGSWEGEWQLIHGNERAALAGPLGVGEQIWLELEMVSKEISKVILGTSLVPVEVEGALRYRVVKRSDGVQEPLATSVEVVLG